MSGTSNGEAGANPRNGRRVALAQRILVCLTVLLLPATAQAVEVKRVISPLGIEAWLVESPAVPVIAMEFAFRGGIELDPPGKEGLANLVAATLDEGAGDLDSDAFQQRLADAGISLDFDAATDAFYGSLKTVTAKSGEAFDLLHLALTQPRLDAEAVERMRAAIQSEIRRRVADPDWIARRVFGERAFPGHPYGRPSRGTAATLAGLTVEDLRGFTARRLARDNLVVAVTGDITAEQLGPVLDRVFGALPAASEPFTVPDTVPDDAGARVLVERAGPQSIMLLWQPGISRSDPDYYAALLMNQILGGGTLTSRLGEEVREKRGLTYGISSFFAHYRHADTLFVNSSLSNANVGAALAIVREEWRRMAEHGVSQEELDDAKTYITGSFALQFTSTSRVASFLLATRLDGRGIDYIDRRNDYVAAVTLADVNRVAARLLDPDALAAVVVGAPDGGLAPTETLRAADIVSRELAQGS